MFSLTLILLFVVKNQHSVDALICVVCGSPPTTWTCNYGIQYTNCSGAGPSWTKCVTMYASYSVYKGCGYNDFVDEINKYISTFETLYLNHSNQITRATVQINSEADVYACETDYCNEDTTTTSRVTTITGTTISTTKTTTTTTKASDDGSSSTLAIAIAVPVCVVGLSALVAALVVVYMKMNKKGCFKRTQNEYKEPKAKKINDPSIKKHNHYLEPNSRMQHTATTSSRDISSIDVNLKPNYINEIDETRQNESEENNYYEADPNYLESKF